MCAKSDYMITAFIIIHSLVSTVIITTKTNRRTVLLGCLKLEFQVDFQVDGHSNLIIVNSESK